MPYCKSIKYKFLDHQNSQENGREKKINHKVSELWDPYLKDDQKGQYKGKSEREMKTGRQR